MEFNSFGKIARWNRNTIITEKIDGTNAQIYIGEDGEFLTGSRKRWITSEDDNFGFSRWAHDHKEELMQLGVGRHFGEWWGMGIQRKYGLQERRFSLFNVMRWSEYGTEPVRFPTQDPRVVKTQQVLPPCCNVVPIVWQGLLEDMEIDIIMESLMKHGSYAAEGFMKPEGIVIYHVASGHLYKKTIEKDSSPKGNS